MLERFVDQFPLQWMISIFGIDKNPLVELPSFPLHLMPALLVCVYPRTFLNSINASASDILSKASHLPAFILELVLDTKGSFDSLKRRWTLAFADLSTDENLCRERRHGDEIEYKHTLKIDLCKPNHLPILKDTFFSSFKINDMGKS